MQTRFTARQLENPAVAASEPILRKCVHCGFCTATCPTYVLLGDELDSPRGRIYLIKEMLENDRPATSAVVQHIDRCLSCLSCMTTCPSGVHYQHLVDHARVHVEQTYRRPFAERSLRAALAAMLPYPRPRARGVGGGGLARPFARLLPAPLRAMLELAPRAPARASRGTATPARGPPRRAARAARKRVALVAGCVQTVIAPEINAATIRLLERCGAEVVLVEGCCGALVHHLGKEGARMRSVPRSSTAACASSWHRPRRDRRECVRLRNARQGLWLCVSRRHGACRARRGRLGESARRDGGARRARLAGRRPEAERLTVAYHSACSMQHGQKVEQPPRALLAAAEFA